MKIYPFITAAMRAAWTLECFCASGTVTITATMTNQAGCVIRGEPMFVMESAFDSLEIELGKYYREMTDGK